MVINQRFSQPTGRGGERLFTPEGPSIRTVSGGGGRPTPPKKLTREQENKLFEQLRKGEITQAQAIGQIRGSEARSLFLKKISSRKEEKRVEVVRGRIDTFQQRLKLGRISDLQKKRLEGKISVLRKNIGAVKVDTRIIPVDVERFEAGLPPDIRNILIKPDEIFNPALNAFVRPSDPSGQATGFIRQPTPEEARVITEARREGSLLGILSKISETEQKLELKLFGERPPGAPTREEQIAELKKKFPAIKVFEFASEGIVRGGEFLGGGKINPTARALTKDVIEDILIFSAFSPLIQTGVVQKSKQTAKIEVKKLTDKEKLKRLSELREEISKASEVKVKDFIRKELTSIKNSGLSVEEKLIRARNFEIFIREARGQIKIIDGNVVPIIDLASVNVATSAPEIVISIPKITKIPAVAETLTITTIPSRLESISRRTINQARINQAKKPLGQRLREAQAGQVGRAFGTPSVFAGTGQFERTESVGIRLAQETKSITSELRQTGLSSGQITNLRSRIDSINTQLLSNKNAQLLRTNQVSNQLVRQIQLSRQRQDSLNRQLLATTTDQRSDQLTKQLQQTKTAQDSLTKQLLITKTLQKSLTEQVNKLKVKSGQRFRLKVKKPFKTKKPFIISKTIVRAKPGKPSISKPKKKNFQVFVRKGGKDILFKSVKTKPKARKEIRKVLSSTLRASGFIFDKKKGVKVKPKIKNPKIYRVGKNDPFRLVERRNKRISRGTGEVTAIQRARRESKRNNPIKKIVKKNPKPFKNKSNFKFLKQIKLKRRKK